MVQRPPAAPEAPEPAEALAAVVARLRSELAGVRTAMRNRAVIEQAKGVLVERLGVSPDEGFDHLVRLSQRTNIKLVEVAAAVVGTTAPDPQVPTVTELVDDELRQHVARTGSRAARGGADPAGEPAATRAARRSPRPPAAEALQAQHQLLTSRISAAEGYDDVVDAVTSAAGAWPMPTVAVLLLLEPDGALRLVGQRGLTPQVSSQWSRIPPLASVPVTAAVQQRRPVLLPDLATLTERFPLLATINSATSAMFAAPLVVDGAIVGAFGLSWAAELPTGDDVARYLAALAEPVARKVAELGRRADTAAPAAEPVADPGAGPWMPLVLETLLHPAALLTPVREDGRITDFRIDLANAAARALLGTDTGDPATATLLAAYPGTGSELLLPELVRLVEEGSLRRLDSVRFDAGPAHGRSARRRQPYQATVHAARVWDRVLFGWRVHSAADLLHDQLLQAERIGRIGSFSWDLRGGEPQCSPQLYRLLFNSAEPRPVPVDELRGRVHDDDLLTVTDAVRGTLLQGRQLATEVRGAGQLAGRRLRLTAEPVTDADGGVVAVRGTVQDVTDERALEARLRLAEEALAAQRRRLEAELRAAQALQQTLLPTEPELGTAVGLAVRGRCRSTAGSDRIAGDWYDAFPLAEDGASLLVIGSVAGTGLDAMSAAARLRYAVRAYAALDMAPSRLLESVNTMLCATEPERTATLVVARYHAGRRELRWAAAGQTAPVRYAADGTATVLAGPVGLPVGASAETPYPESVETLERGHRVLFYTDGLLGVGDRQAALHARAGVNLDDVESIVQHLVRRGPGRADEDMCALLVRITR
jgi:PAS domain-containing protein